MKRFIIGALLAGSLLTQTACNEQKLVDGFAAGFSVLSIATSVQISVVESLRVDGEITPEEANEFIMWAWPIPNACEKAIAELKADGPAKTKLLKAAKILKDAQQAAVFEHANPKVKAAYIAVSATLDTLIIQMEIAAAK